MPQTALTPFHFDTHEVRIHLDVAGEPLWIATDVCAALDIRQVTRAVKRLDDDEKGVISIHTPGGTQDVWAVNESGLYNLILGSRKPDAKRFKRWVTHDVLPQIRQTGRYHATSASHLDASPDMKAIVEMAHAIAEQRQTNARLIAEQDVIKAEQVRHSQDMIANQQATIAAQSDALQAKEIALVAIRSQSWVTIRQYVYMMHRDVRSLMPEKAQKAFAIHLGDVCRSRGAPMYKALTADTSWPDERTYPIGMIDEILPPWLQRQSAQIHLVGE